MSIASSPASFSPSPSPWPRVWLLYLAGLLAAAQLGKLSALAPLIAASLGLRLPTIALAISLIEVGGATLGVVAGLLAQRFGLRRTLRCGVGALALAGLGGASVDGAVGLFGWRLLEAAGYLGVIVSAPVLIARYTAADTAAAAAGMAAARVQGLAMTLWSTFVPLGLALGAAASAGAAGVPGVGWRGAVAAGGGVAAGLWLVLWRARLPAQPTAAVATRGSSLPPAVWCLALGFGAFALFEVGILALLPTLLVRERGMAMQAAGQWTAVVAVAGVGGAAVAALLLRRGADVRWPVALALGVPPLLLFGVFTQAPWVAQPAVTVGLAVLLNLLGGVFASLAFALLPQLVAEPAQMARANGLLAQCGASGSLLGPPAMAACVQVGGWPAAAWLGLAASLLALPLAWRAVSAAGSAGAAGAAPARAAPAPAALTKSGETGAGQAGLRN